MQGLSSDVFVFLFVAFNSAKCGGPSCLQEASARGVESAIHGPILVAWCGNKNCQAAVASSAHRGSSVDFWRLYIRRRFVPLYPLWVSSSCKGACFVFVISMCFICSPRVARRPYVHQGGVPSTSSFRVAGDPAGHRGTTSQQEVICYHLFHHFRQKAFWHIAALHLFLLGVNPFCSTMVPGPLSVIRFKLVSVDTLVSVYLCICYGGHSFFNLRVSGSLIKDMYCIFSPTVKNKKAIFNMCSQLPFQV